MASFISLTDLIYPVGAYYLSSSSTSPASLFGGSWSDLTGRFLYCDNGTQTGGSNTHTLTVSEMPSHRHLTYVRVNWYDPAVSSGSSLAEQWGSDGSRLRVDADTAYSSYEGGVCSQQYASISDMLLLEENLLTYAEVRRNG